MKYNKNIRYWDREEQIFSPSLPTSLAWKQLGDLEERIISAGFEKVKEREMMWANSVFLKSYDKDIVKVETYFEGQPENVRKYQSVRYNVTGKEEESKKAIEDIGKLGVYGCR